MNRLSNCIALIVLSVFASCKAVRDSNTAVTYVNYTHSELNSKKADGFGSIPGVEVGVMYGGEGKPDRAVGIVGDIALRLSSSDNEWRRVDVSVDSVGARTGLRYYYDTGTPYIQPFIGGGILLQQYWLKDDTSSAQAGTLGFIGTAGLESQVSESMRINLGYSRTAGIRPKVDGEQLNMDSHAFIFGLGWSF